jgi:RNA polymerase sigma factor (sigma-70 family)
MAAAQMETAIRHLRQAVLRQDRAGRTDGQLLASFIEDKDEAAFEALVRRHGPMVFGVCCRVARNHHDAEDAFQATFLVLARKASSVRPRDKLANWLHGVALRTAMKAKALMAKRRRREQQVTEMPEPEAVRHGHGRDLQHLLDQELKGLPENYRLPIILCDLEGKRIKDAAQQLGWLQGTLAGRLARGRKLLSKRLACRGVHSSAGSLVALLSRNLGSAGVPTSLVNPTVKAATLIAAGQAVTTGSISMKVAALTEGVVKAMLLTKLKTAVTVLLMLGIVAFGGIILTHGGRGGPEARAAQPNNRTWLVSFVDSGTVAPATEKARDTKKQPEATKKAVAKRDTNKSDLDRLQGVWSVVSIESGGKPYKLEKAVFMVDGKRACLQSSGFEIQGGLYLEPAINPKTYDLAMSNRTIEGIYSLDGDTLRLCYAMGTESKRPGGFITKKGSQQVLLVLKQIHGPEGFPFRLPDGTRAFPTIIEKANTAPPPIPRQVPDQRPSPYNEVARTVRVGQIIVVGNTKTETSVILKRIPLSPGAVLDFQALRAAEKNLAAFNPTITVIENGESADFKDIRVTVQEK